MYIGVSEESTKVMEILEALENGVVDPTLPRLGEEDVAWDMDMNVVENTDDESERTDESSKDDCVEMN